MPTTATTTALAPSLLRRRPPFSPSAPPLPSPIPSAAAAAAAPRQAIRAAFPQVRGRCVSCQVALTTEAPASSDAEAEAEAVAKVGARVRVTAPVKVYHVAKAPDLDLCGMEGTIKQYVGVWKGRPVSANLPFKVEFYLPVDGEAKPVKLFAHLKEDEFEYLPSSD